MINTSGISYLISKDYDKVFKDSFMASDAQFKEVFNIIDSKDSYNKFAGYTGLGLVPKKTKGVNAIFNTPVQKFAKTFTPDTYSLGVRIEKEAFDDDKTGNLRKIPADLGESSRVTFEVDCAALLSRCQSGSYLGGDGKTLCATNHPLYGSGASTTYSNKPTTDVDLSVSAIESAIPALRGTKNDQSIATGLRGKYLVTHPDNWATIIQLLENQDKAGTANRDSNAIKTLRLTPILLDHLADTDGWWIITEKKYHQLMLVMREPVSTKSYPAPDNTDDAIFRVRFRKTEGWISPLGLYGCDGL